ncbi:MAG: LytTR family DNA-binding domain-containing protein [Cyclobacteriaceae bacterium]
MMVKREILNLKVFDFSLKMAAIRYGVIVLLSLVNAHLKLDMTNWAEYQFPMRSFSNVLIFGVIICTASWVVTRIFKERIFHDHVLNRRSSLSFLGINALVAFITYTALYLFKFGTPIDPVTFSAYLFITIAVIIIENLIYLLYCSTKGLKELKSYVSKNKETTLLIPCGNHSQVINTSDISYIEKSEGLINFFLKDGSRLISQYVTLDEVGELLSTNQFYRANRSVILNRNSIKTVKKGVNRKLKLLIENERTEINVSRYKRKEIIDWIEQPQYHSGLR